MSSAPCPSAPPRFSAASSTAIRFRAALVLVPAVALLALATWLSPDASGTGTHQQLGLRTCAWRDGGGIPCPTCGMTTAFALAAEGRILSAFVTQPAGALLALVTAMTAWIAAWVLLTASPAARYLRGLWRPATAIGTALAVLGAWAYTAATS